MTIYFVETTLAEQRELVCRWTERFYMEKKRVQIVVDSTASAQLMDQLLWRFSQSSFITHMIFNPGEFQVAGFGALVCEGPADLEFMTRFETAVHFILRDDTQRLQQSRILWQRARDSGTNPVHVPYGRQV